MPSAFLTKAQTATVNLLGKLLPSPHLDLRLCLFLLDHLFKVPVVPASEQLAT
jgi:hypothetical protein